MKKQLKLSIIITAIIFTGCGVKHSNQTFQSANSGASNPYSPSVIYQDTAPTPAPMVVKRIITQSADIMVEVESIDKAKASLETLITNSGRYITNSNSYESRYNASVKVPSSKLQATLNKISKLGNKLSQSISQNDVTNQFIDNKARLKNLILFRDKMQKLLNQTTNIQEIVKIEKEIRRVQIEIDALKGRQKYLKDAVALSPISVDFKEKTIYGPIGYIVNGLWWVTKKLFVIR